MDLCMDPSEQRVLGEILESALGDLREQVYKADTSTFRERLRDRETLVTGLLEKLRAAEQPMGERTAA